jgi:hypothetical protein
MQDNWYLYFCVLIGLTLTVGSILSVDLSTEVRAALAFLGIILIQSGQIDTLEKRIGELEKKTCPKT